MQRYSFLYFVGSVVQLAPAPLGYGSQQQTLSQSGLTVTSNSTIDEASLQQK